MVTRSELAGTLYGARAASKKGLPHKQTCAYVPSISVLGLGVGPGSGSRGSAPPPAPMPLSSGGSCRHGPSSGSGGDRPRAEAWLGLVATSPHARLFPFSPSAGRRVGDNPNSWLTLVSHEPALCKLPPNSTSPPPAITRPLASTQLVIHLSPQRAAPGPAPHQPQRGFPRSRPPPPDATDTHAGSASGHAAAGPRTLMHCTSRRISSLGQVGEPRLIML